MGDDVLDRLPVRLDQRNLIVHPHVPGTSQHEAANSVLDPPCPFDRAISNPLIARDHDETQDADNLQPNLICRCAWYLWQRLVSRMDNIRVEFSQSLGQQEVVLVDEPTPAIHAAYECAVSSNAQAARTSSMGIA